MTLANQNTGMVDTLGQSQLEDLCLQTAFQEVFKTQTEDVIELHLGLIEHSNTDQSTKQSITCSKHGVKIKSVYLRTKISTGIKIVINYYQVTFALQTSSNHQGKNAGDLMLRYIFFSLI